MTTPTRQKPQLSELIYGCWRLQDTASNTQDTLAKIQTCLDHRIDSFDHADIYGNYACESAFGKALKQNPSLKSRIKIITKCGIQIVSPANPSIALPHYDASKQHIISAAERSLKNLSIDRIDVLLLHRPDFLMDASEVADAFTTLIEQGKAKHVGVSNFSASQFKLLQSRFDFPLVTNQLQFSVLHTAALTDGSLDQCQEQQIQPMAWSPTAGGKLFTGKDEQSIRVRQCMEKIALQHDASIDQIAYAWLMKHPSKPRPILGSNQLNRIISAAQSTTIQLTTQQWYQILCASRGHDVA